MQSSTTTVDITTTNPSNIQSQLSTQLYDACTNGNLDQMKLLIEQNADPYTLYYIDFKHLPQHIAIGDNDDDDFDEDYTYPFARYPSRNEPNHSLLHITAIFNPNNNGTNNNIINIIDYLMTFNFNINETDYYSNSILVFAVMYGHSSLVQHLIKKYNINIQIQIHTPNCCYSILDIAAKYNQGEIFKYLLTLNFSSQQIDTTPHRLAKNGNYDAFKHLYELDNSITAITTIYGDSVLHSATKSNNTQLIDFLINDIYIDVEVTNNVGHTPLYAAAFSNWVAFKHLLTQHKANHNIFSEFSSSVLESLLHNTALTIENIDELSSLGFSIQNSNISGLFHRQCHNLSIIKHLIQHYTLDIHATNYQNRSLLHHIVSAPECTIDDIVYFVQLGLDINHEADRNFTPLSYAIQYNCSLDIIKSLINHNATLITEKEFFNCFTRFTTPELIDYLIQSNITTQETNFCTQILTSSVSKGNFAIAKHMIEIYNIPVTPILLSQTISTHTNNSQLLQYLLNVHSQHFNINDPIPLSNYSSTTSIIEFAIAFCPWIKLNDFKCLIQYGASINTDSKLNTLYHICTSNYIWFQLASYIIQHLNIDPNHATVLGEHILHYICNNSRIQHRTIGLDRFIRQFHFNINISDTSGTTLLQDAAMNINLPLIELLILHKADVNQGTQQPLTICVEKGDLLTTTAILEAKGNINHTTTSGSTIMHIAATSHSCKMLNLLFQYGGQLNQQDLQGTPPLFNAALRQYLEVMNWFMEHNANFMVQNVSKETIFHQFFKFRMDDNFSSTIISKTIEYLIDSQFN